MIAVVSGLAPATRTGAAGRCYGVWVVKRLGLGWGVVFAAVLGCATGDDPTPGASNPFGNNPTPTSQTNSGGESGGTLQTTGISGSTAGDEAGDGETEDSGNTGNTGDTGNTSAEAVCGDGVLQGAESCDGKELGAMTCMDFGFTEGVLVCDGQCNLLTDGCRSCGDGMLAASELCDGAALGGETCQSQGFGGGTLACDPQCDGYDTAACTPLPTCGDGMLNGGEACDGNQLGGASCTSIGFDQGQLACTAVCTHDTSGCEFLTCGGQGDFCLFDENNPQGSCCPAGVAGNVLGICALLVCQ